jgi:hypothetical protein
MTDRELHTQPSVSAVPRPTAPAAAHPDLDHEGNGSLMTATIAPRPPVRTPPAPDPADRGRAWVTRLFAGDFSFPSVPARSLALADRPAAEHDAVSRAAACPDLFIVHADLGAGERVIVDLARAAPDRVLILSPDPVAADRITERLLKAGVAAMRALADDENPNRPSPTVSRATSRALGGAQTEHARRTATAAVVAAEQRVAAFAVVAKAVARLTEVGELLKKLDAETAELTRRFDRIEAEVAGEAAGAAGTAFSERMERWRVETGAVLTTVAERRTAARKLADDKETEVAALRQQYAAVSNKSGFFTRLFSKQKPAIDPEDLKKHLTTAEAELATLTTAAAARQAEADARASEFAAERQKAVAEEMTARRASVETSLAGVEAERTRALAESTALNKVIGAAVPDDDHETAERALAAARERLAEVARSGPEALARAAAEVRIVVGTPGCLDADRVFAALPDEPHFGLLVLDRAEELPESEFPRLARRSERWVLVGDASARDEPRLSNGAARSRPGRGIEVPFVARLARLLDRETWAPEGDRIVCRLAHLTPEQRRSVTCEPLADRPEIELRFAASDADPVLAEIAFPASTPLPGAKSFLFHTLGEVLLRPCGECVWAHAPDAITVTWPAADVGRDATWIDLEPGVREKVVGPGLFAYTAAVHFDPAAGWNAERAAEWLVRHLPPAAGRFVAVPRAAGPRA